VQQRVLAAAGVSFEQRSVNEAAHRAEVLAALGPNGLSRLPAVRINDAWLADDPDWLAVRAALRAPPAPWRPERGDAMRVQWFARPDSPPCEAARSALAAADVPVETSNVAEPGAEERMWITARLLGRGPRDGLALPFVVLDDAAFAGCPTLGLLAETLAAEGLWVQAETALAAAPDLTGEAVVGALNFARLLPRRLLEEALGLGRLRAEDALAAQLRFARPVEPHRWVAVSVGANADLPAPDFVWRSVPSAGAAAVRLLAENEPARAALLDETPLDLAVQVTADPLFGMELRLWLRPRATDAQRIEDGEALPLSDASPKAGNGSVFRPRPDRQRGPHRAH
jgi:hypothetical protein